MERAHKKPKSILVTGGAGFIGGQTVLSLLSKGERVVVLDDLSTGMIKPYHKGTRFYEGQVQDFDALCGIICRENIDRILHFAGSIRVDESLRDPLKYYDNNTNATRTLVSAAVNTKVKVLIFSSTAAVYGTTVSEKVDENHQCNPLNPYGQSKLFAEKIIQETSRSLDQPHYKYGIFRYFNVAGADHELRNGQNTLKPDHLIGRTINAALGLGEELTVYGDAYETIDGTGVRDYIHVMDVADAHVAFLGYLYDGGESGICNLGYGQGYSVLQVLKAVENIVGSPVPYKIGAMRDGEAGSVIADVNRFYTAVGWLPHHNDLNHIIATAYHWILKNRRD